MALDDYNPSTALTAYYPSRDERRPARLWATEKLLHDLKAVGIVDFFEGPGTDPTGLTGYASTKVWLRVSSGVTDAPGEIRAYDGGGDASLLENWPELTAAGFAAFLGPPTSGQVAATGAFMKAIDTSDNITQGSINRFSVTYSSRAAVSEITVPAAQSFLVVAGHTTTGDNGHGLYVRSVSEPSHAGKVQDSGGAWFELIESHPRPEQFGGFPDYTVGGSDTTVCTTAFINAHAYAVAKGVDNVHLIGGTLAYLVKGEIEGKPIMWWSRSGAKVACKGMTGAIVHDFLAATKANVVGGSEGITYIIEGADIQSVLKTAKSADQYTTYRTRYVWKSAVRGAVADSNKFQSAFDYTAAVAVDIGDCVHLHFEPTYMQGAFDMQDDPSGQTEDCPLRLDAASAILGADIYFGKCFTYHTLMQVVDNAFYTVHDGFDGIGLYKGIIESGTSSFAEPKIGKGNLNVQHTGIAIKTNSRLIEGVTIRRHKDGYASASHDWKAITTTGSKVTIANCLVEVDDSVTTFAGDRTMIEATGGGSVDCRGNIQGLGINKGYVFDGTAGFSVEAGVLAGEGTSQTYVELANNARRGKIDKPKISSLTAESAYTLIAHDGSIDWTTIDADQCLGIERLPAFTELTIASGVVTATKSFHAIDTEADAASDDLDTITPSAWMTNGTELNLKAISSSRTVSVTEAGNIRLVSSPRDLTHSDDWLVLVYDNSVWKEVSFSDVSA